MNGVTGWVGLAAGGAVLLLATSAIAQDGASKAAAEIAFEEGKKLMKGGRYAEACPKFAESSKLDPGVGILFYLADCYEKAGLTASAWAAFREATAAARVAGQADREKIGRDRSAALEPRLAKLTIVVPKAADLPGLEVKRDGVTIGRALWESPVPTDPGSHRIDATSPGRRPWATEQVAKEGATATVAVPVLEPEPIANAPATPGTPPAPTPEGPAPSTWSAQRTAAVAAAGVGVVGIGLGAGFGISAIVQHAGYVKECPQDHCLTLQGVTDHDSAARAATISTAAFSAGLAAGATGVVLWLTAPKAARPASSGAILALPVVGRSSAGAVIAGRW
jgi:hypothetical protein